MPYASLGGLKARKGERNIYKNFTILNDLIKKYEATPHTIILAWMRCRYPNTILHITGSDIYIISIYIYLFILNLISIFI